MKYRKPLKKNKEWNKFDISKSKYRYTIEYLQVLFDRKKKIFYHKKNKISIKQYNTSKKKFKKVLKKDLNNSANLIVILDVYKEIFTKSCYYTNLYKL